MAPMSDARENARQSENALFERARGGDQAAWRELFEACYPKVIRVVRRRLHSTRIRSLYDSTDFACDVMKSLAANAQELDFPTMDSLMAFLIRVAENKLADEHRKQFAQKRDKAREHGMAAEVASGEPTASQVAVGREELERLLAHQNPQVRTLIELRRDGYKNEEIAERLDWHIRKVQRVLKDLNPSNSAEGD
jgi:RNA polymerase sigma factor (sigma-70 family)